MPTFTFTTFPNVPQKSIIPLVAAIGGLLLSQTKVVETLAYPYANEVHTVFYATDRAAAAAGDTAMFTRDTSNGGNISYGSAVAHLPWKRETNVRLILWRPSSALQRPFITDQKSMTADEFKQAITLVTRASERDSAFLFVHGFRVPFVDALTTAGQLARDLKFDGAPILFSWPAGDAVTEYIHDYDNANWAADHLERLLTTIVTDVQPKRFHLIAHSMGTRVMALALDKLKDRQPDSEHRFENIIFAAADLDPLMFDQTMPAVTHFGRRTTLYICDCDWALFASTKAHFGPRVGMVRNSYPSIDVIDAGTIDHAVLELNHSYLVESETMLTDLFVMINFNRSPAGRPSMAIDGCCWVFMKRGVN
jgi:esterase/lipase superfamily enzyme